MRETRLSGSEGGGTELNRSFLPLSGFHQSGHMSHIFDVMDTIRPPLPLVFTQLLAHG